MPKKVIEVKYPLDKIQCGEKYFCTKILFWACCLWCLSLLKSDLISLLNGKLVNLCNYDTNQTMNTSNEFSITTNIHSKRWIIFLLACVKVKREKCAGEMPNLWNQNKNPAIHSTVICEQSNIVRLCVSAFQLKQQNVQKKNNERIETRA